MRGKKIRPQNCMDQSKQYSIQPFFSRSAALNSNISTLLPRNSNFPFCSAAWPFKVCTFLFNLASLCSLVRSYLLAIPSSACSRLSCLTISIFRSVTCLCKSSISSRSWRRARHLKSLTLSLLALSSLSATLSSVSKPCIWASEEAIRAVAAAHSGLIFELDSIICWSRASASRKSEVRARLGGSPNARSLVITQYVGTDDRRC